MRFGVAAGLLAFLHFMTVFILLMTVFLQGFVRGIGGIGNMITGRPLPEQPPTDESVALTILTQPLGVVLRAIGQEGNLLLLLLNSIIWGIALAALIRWAWRTLRPKPAPEPVLPLDE